MLASILAALALGASSAIAAPAPLPHVLSSADLANPVVERIVGTVACEKVHTGTLTLVGPKTHSVNAGYDGYRNQNGLQVLVTAKADIPTPAQQFEFRACNSSFMGYTEIDSMAADVYYGHVSPVNAPNHCLSASERSSPNATFVSDKCSDSDDSSQLFQYFSLTKQPASSSSKVTYYLQFEPTPEQERGSSDFPGAYSLGKATKGDEHVVALKYSEINSTPDNTYGFQLN